jgi:hypothetical protein
MSVHLRSNDKGASRPWDRRLWGLASVFVVFSEVAEGVQISHVSDPTIDGAVGCSCAILNSSRRDNSGCLRRAGYGDEGLQDEDRGKMLLNDCQQSLLEAEVTNRGWLGWPGR